MTIIRSAYQPIDLVFTPEKKSWPVSKFTCGMSLSPKSFYSQESVPEAKNLVVDLEKRTIPYLSVSARIRVIDPFNQMKREYNTILDDADSANRNNFVAFQSFA